MPFSQQDADKAYEQYQIETGKHFAAKDAKGLTSMYHPDSVLISQGEWAAYGLEEILKRNKEIINMPFNFNVKPEATTFSNNGEFIYHKSFFYQKQDPKKSGWYSVILKRGDDGKYLVYHDIFNMKDLF
jgi:ketosteroid isomerase-like protein